jgi:acyl-CoA thioesterase-1
MLPRIHRLLPCGARRRKLLVAGLAGFALPAALPAPSATRVVLVVGDSLSAEYGLPRGKGWVPLLAARLAKASPQYSVVNASISGDTSSGGRARLPALLREHRPAIVVIELGGNDALRGLPIAAMRANLEAMARDARETGAKVLLVGMQMPPNYGEAFTTAFADSFGIVARSQGLALLPFLLEGLPQGLDAFQPDGIHPGVGAQPRMMENVWGKLQGLLK